MALDFPASPSPGAEHNAANGLKYTYDGVKWTSQGTYSSGTIAPVKLDSIASSFNGSTKTFNLTQGGTTVNAHSAESVLISVAGVVKEPTTDYTVDVAAGTITFTTAPTSGQAFWGVVYSRLPVDLQTNLAKTGGTMKGDIVLGPDVKLQFEGTTDNNFETTVQADDPTSDNIIKFPDNSGHVMLNNLRENAIIIGTSEGIINKADVGGDLTASYNSTTDEAEFTVTNIGNANIHIGVGKTFSFEGTTANDHEITITTGEPTADRTITFPDADGHVMLNNLRQDAVIIGTSEGIINKADVGGDLTASYNSSNDKAEFTIANGKVTKAKLDQGLIIETSEVSGHTPDNNTIYTTQAIDDNFYKLGSVEEIQSGETWTAADNKIATTSAIDARITDLVDDVGGFVPIANETSFPSTNPDVNNGAGTLVSVKSISSTRTPSGGTVTITDGAGSGNDVTITGCGSTALTATFGCIVETTTTLHTYTFHRLTPKATEVTTVASNVASVNTVAGSIADVNAYADQYQIATTPPTTDGGGNSLANGDLWFDSSSNKQMMVYDGSAGDGFSAVTPSQSVLNDISNVSGQLTYAEDLGSIADALTTETGNNINTVATNMNDINSFADQYKVAASAPNSPSQGDLWYDSSNTILKYYNGSSWATISSGGILNLIEDQTPELYAALDCNDKNLTEVATVSGDNLQIDFGAIA